MLSGCPQDENEDEDEDEDEDEVEEEEEEEEEDVKRAATFSLIGQSISGTGADVDAVPSPDDTVTAPPVAAVDRSVRRLQRSARAARASLYFTVRKGGNRSFSIVLFLGDSPAPGPARPRP